MKKEAETPIITHEKPARDYLFLLRWTSIKVKEVWTRRKREREEGKEIAYKEREEGEKQRKHLITMLERCVFSSSSSFLGVLSWSGPSRDLSNQSAGGRKIEEHFLSNSMDRIKKDSGVDKKLRVIDDILVGGIQKKVGARRQQQQHKCSP